MSDPFLIFEDGFDGNYKFYIAEEVGFGYFIGLKECLADVWDYDVCECLEIEMDEYRKQLEKFHGHYVLMRRTTYFKNKKDAEKVLEWIESMQIAMKLSNRG